VTLSRRVLDQIDVPGADRDFLSVGHLKLAATRERNHELPGPVCHSPSEVEGARELNWTPVAGIIAYAPVADLGTSTSSAWLKPSGPV
jgi:hypothetical protein